MSNKEFRKALDIFDKHNAEMIAAAEHDEIFSDLSTDEVPENSSDGKALRKQGWRVDTSLDLWTHFI